MIRSILFFAENAIEKEIRDSFPPSFHSSKLGLKLSEDALQQRYVLFGYFYILIIVETRKTLQFRSFMLNKWIIFIFKVFPSLREDAQVILSNNNILWLVLFINFCFRN